MPRRSRLSIPHALRQIRAQQIYERRIAEGRSGSPEGDWEQAANELTNRWWIVRTWQLKKAISKFFRRLTRSFKALMDVIWKILIFPFWLFYRLPQLFANTGTRPFALDVVKTIISAASLLAAIIAAIGLFVNYQDAIEDRRLTQERLVTDRFAKAVEQLGNSKEEVIIGGIYSLERIAKDSPKDQWTIMEVLTAFVQKNSPILVEIKELEERSEEKLEALEKLDPVNIQIQAALTVIGRRDPERDYTSDEAPELKTKRLDLSNSNLSSVNLSDADLWNADLWNANLSGADLIGANLYDADLSDANLSSANLIRADLIRADLIRADLRDAFLYGAVLSDANLIGAYLIGAYLSDADLFRADLFDAYLRDAYLRDAKNLSNYQLKSACFWEKAIYTDAEWDLIEEKWIAADETANQKRIEEIKQDKASDPEKPPNCNNWK